jgi:hypothetical protein
MMCKVTGLVYASIVRLRREAGPVVVTLLFRHLFHRTARCVDLRRSLKVSGPVYAWEEE